MDSSDPSPKRTRRIPPKVVVVDACRTNDISKIDHAIELASLPGSRDTVQDILSHAVSIAVTRNAEDILSYVLAKGASVPDYSYLPGEELPSIQILEILIAHGWDINACRPNSKTPFLWKVVGDHDLVVWALEHGASIQPRDQQPFSDDEPLRDHNEYTPLLEKAVQYCCTTSTFDLLRSKGAPITRRVLHFAAQKAVHPSELFVEQRVAFVKHLLDEYSLDVNAVDHPSSGMGNHYGTPLCYVALKGSSNCKDITELLLDKGADPDLDVGAWSAMSLAEQQKSTQFLEVVIAWKENHRND